MNWIQLDTGDAAFFGAADAAFRKVKAGSKGFHLRHDLHWIRETHQKAAVSVLTCDGDEPDSYALVFRRPRALPFQIGEITWLRKKITRTEIWEGPVFTDPDLSVEDAHERTRALLDTLHRGLKAGDALSIEGLPVGSPLHDLVHRDAAVKRQYIALPLGQPFAHQFIHLPDTLEAYLGGMSRKTRKNLRYEQRRLERDFTSTEGRAYTSEDSVDAFLDAAVPLSMKTYQWQLLGLGLRDRAHLKETFGYAARMGWLRNYIQFVDGQAVAFMLGYLYEGCYYYTDVGFDPDWAKWSVGSVLQLNVIEDLYGLEQVPDRFDFGTGYGIHKALFGNHERTEVNVLLLPNTASNRMLAALYKVNGGLDAAVSFCLETLGIKKALKKLVRARKSG